MKHVSNLDNKVAALLKTKTISLLLMRGIPAILLVVMVYLYTTKNGAYFDFAEKMGSLTLQFIIIILIIKPLSVLFRRIKTFSAGADLRKELGLLSFYTALLHGFGYIFADRELLEFSTDPTHFIFWGMLGFIGMILLGVTSNKWSIKTLGVWWFRLHKLIYAVLVFVLVHVALIEQDPSSVMPLVLVVGLKIAEGYVSKRRQATT